MGVPGDVKAVIEVDKIASQRGKKHSEHQSEQEYAEEKDFPVLNLPDRLEWKFQNKAEPNPAAGRCPFSNLLF